MEEQKQWSENDELFISLLKGGHLFQVYVGLLFLKEGFMVQIPKLKIRKDISEASEYEENDIDLIVKVGDEEIVFEIKSRDIYFTCIEDFPYDTIIADTVRGWERKKKKPKGVICISQKTKELIYLPSKNSKNWKIESVFDRVRKIPEKCWAARKEDALPFSTLMKCMIHLRGSNKSVSEISKIVKEGKEK